jgi:hypothetical protein
MSTEQSAPDINVVSASQITSHFRMVFLCVVIVTLFALGVDALFTLMVRSPTEEQKHFLDLLGALVTAGFGAIIGLIGGKLT